MMVCAMHLLVEPSFHKASSSVKILIQRLVKEFIHKHSGVHKDSTNSPQQVMYHIYIGQLCSRQDTRSATNCILRITSVSNGKSFQIFLKSQNILNLTKFIK